MTEPSQLTTRGYPYPAGNQPANEWDNYLRRLAEKNDARPGVSPLTTTQRDALSGVELWTGRVIWNTTIGRMQHYNGSAWVNTNPLTVVAKAADESVTSSTTLHDDAALSLAVEANSKYLVDVRLLLLAGSATPDFKFGFSVPAGASVYWAPEMESNVASGGFSVYWSPSTAAAASAAQALLTTGVLNVQATTTLIGLHLLGTLITAGTAGDLKLQWAQQTSDAAAATVKAGSALQIVKVA